MNLDCNAADNFLGSLHVAKADILFVLPLNRDKLDVASDVILTTQIKHLLGFSDSAVQYVGDLNENYSVFLIFQ